MLLGMDISNTEPTQITAGDTIAWSKSLAAYPASDGFVLHYALQMLGGGLPIKIDAAAAGDDHAISITAATSGGWAAGDYSWFSYVTKDAERYSVEQGSISIAPDPLKFNAKTDLRSHAQRTLDSIEAVIEGRATQVDEEFEINIAGNTTKLKAVAIGELLAVRDRYVEMVKREQTARDLAQGKGGGGRILTRFV